MLAAKGGTPAPVSSLEAPGGVVPGCIRLETDQTPVVEPVGCGREAGWSLPSGSGASAHDEHFVRMPGLDPQWLDPQPDPPHRQPGESRHTRAGKRGPVIRHNRPGQPILLENLPKTRWTGPPAVEQKAQASRYRLG